MSKPLSYEDILWTLKQEPKGLPDMDMTTEERAALLFWLFERLRAEEKDTAE